MKQLSKSKSVTFESRSKPDVSPHGDVMSKSELNLANHFLIAMPSTQDPMFGGSVVYLCEHNEHGAMGVIINKPTEMNIETLLDRIDIKVDLTRQIRQETKKLVMFGGPVQDDRGFVLHAPGASFTSTMEICDSIAFTTSRDILDAVAQGRGPHQLLVSVGYAGWGPGQLEEEMMKNGWLTVQAEPGIVFDLPIEQRFDAAIKLLGFDPMKLSGQAGHA